MSTETQTWKELDLNLVEEAFDAPTAKPKLSPGFYKGVVQRVTQQTSKRSNNLMLNIALQPVDADDKPSGPWVNLYMGVPVRNPDVSGHTISERALKFMITQGRSIIKALVGSEELPKYPTKNTDGEYCHPEDGSVLSKAACKKMFKEVDKASAVLIAKYYSNPTVFLGATTYFKVKKEENGFTGVQYVRRDTGKEEVKFDNFTD